MKEKAKGLYFEETKGEYLFISIPALEHYFVKPCNIKGNFFHSCTAYLIKKDDEVHAEIFNRNNRDR